MDHNTLEKILVCPKCKNPLIWEASRLSCENNVCASSYNIKDGIVHFNDRASIEYDELSITVNTYNETANTFAEKHSIKNIDEWPFLPSVEKIKELTVGTMILDAGSGIGRDTDFLAQLGYNVVGIDISVNMIEVGRRIGHYAYSTPVLGNFHRLPFSRNSFDIIWACASLLHTPKGKKIRQILDEFHYVIKENGLLYIVMMKRDDRFNQDGWETKEGRGTRFFSYYSKSELEQVLLESGFEALPGPMYSWENDSKYPERPSWIHIMAKSV